MQQTLLMLYLFADRVCFSVNGCSFFFVFFPTAFPTQRFHSSNVSWKLQTTQGEPGGCVSLCGVSCIQTLTSASNWAMSIAKVSTFSLGNQSWGFYWNLVVVQCFASFIREIHWPGFPWRDSSAPNPKLKSRKLMPANALFTLSTCVCVDQFLALWPLSAFSSTWKKGVITLKSVYSCRRTQSVCSAVSKYLLVLFPGASQPQESTIPLSDYNLYSTEGSL